MRIILVLALSGAASAVPRQPIRIAGGESTPIENYPFMGSMLLNFLGQISPFCSSTLVTNTALVSAAHCLILSSPSLWQVRLGSIFHTSGGIVHAVSRLILHPEYNPYVLLNDIAVVRLTKPAVFSNKINTARIAGPSYILPDNTLVHAVGWGATEWQGKPPEDLQYVAVKVINHKIYTERYAYLATLPGMHNIPDVTPEMSSSPSPNVVPGREGG